METEAKPDMTSDVPRVKLTPEAVEYAKKKRVELGKPLAALRLGVRGGGCAGFTYVTDFTEDPPRRRDVVYEYDGLSVYVDNRSLEYIEGSVISFENTLMYQGLKWNNPQQETSCGCGLTFSLKKRAEDQESKQLKTIR
jgi:iron-sulfur cluster assembly protein